MGTSRHITVLVADSGFTGRLPEGAGVSVIPLLAAKPSDVRRAGTNLFVIAAATQLDEVAELVREANAVHKLRALFVRADIDCAWFLPMLERAQLRTLRNMVVHTSPSVPERVLRAWAVGAQDDLVADATVTDDRLLVRSCAIRTYEVRFADVPSLSRLPAGSRSEFTMDPDGSFLHWDRGDIHLGLDGIRYAVDPRFRAQADLDSLTYQKRFGAAVAELRVRQGIRQTDIPMLSAREVSRIESGEVSPRLETIAKLAGAHGMGPEAYLGALSDALARVGGLAGLREG